jgi:group I intron endonuclease
VQVYLITNLMDGTLYVGKTSQSLKQRWIEHRGDASRHRYASHLHRAMRKHGIENFTMVPLVPLNFDITTAEELSVFERDMIRVLRKTNRLYNLTDGGDGSSGAIRSEETCRRMSNAQRGRVQSEDTRRKIRDANRRLFCKRGHPMIGDNVYLYTNKDTGRVVRSCKMCGHARTIAFSQRKISRIAAE